jgi:hypothetical protein
LRISPRGCPVRSRNHAPEGACQSDRLGHIAWPLLPGQQGEAGGIGNA